MWASCCPYFFRKVAASQSAACQVLYCSQTGGIRRSTPKPPASKPMLAVPEAKKRRKSRRVKRNLFIPDRYPSPQKVFFCRLHNNIAERLFENSLGCGGSIAGFCVELAEEIHLNSTAAL